MTWCDSNSWWKDRLYTKKANRIPRDEIDSIEIPFANYTINLQEINCYKKIPYLICNNLNIINPLDDTDIKKTTVPFTCEILEGSNISIDQTISLQHWELDKFCEWSVASLRHIGTNNTDKIDGIKSHYIDCSVSSTGTGLYLVNLSSIDNSYLIAKNFYIDNCTINGSCILDIGSGIIAGNNTCIIDGNLSCQNIIFSGGVVFQGTGEITNAQFLNDATNQGLLYISSGIFKDGGQNKGKIIGNTIFDDAINLSNISGDCIFLNNAINFGNIYGETIFSGSAINSGTVTKNAYFYDHSSNFGMVSGNGRFIDNSQNIGSVIGDSFFDIESINSGNLSSSSIFKKNSINAGMIVSGSHYFSFSNNLGTIYNSVSCTFIMTGINYGNLYNINSISFMSGSNNNGDIALSKSISFSDSGINNGPISAVNQISFINKSKNNGDILNSKCVFQNLAINHGLISSGWYYNNSINMGITNIGFFYNYSHNSGTISNTGIFNDWSKNFSNVNIGLFFYNSINTSNGDIQNARFAGNSINDGMAKTGLLTDKSINLGTINSAILSDKSANYGTIGMGGAVMKNNSITSGIILGTGWFYDSAANYTNLDNEVFFYNRSRNYGDLLSEAIFYNTSKNIGRCFNNGIFKEQSENLGVLLGSGLFEHFSKNRGYCSGENTQFKNYSINMGEQIPIPIGMPKRSLIMFFDGAKNESYIDMNNNTIQFYDKSINNGSLINKNFSILGLGNIIFENSTINNGNISGLNTISFGLESSVSCTNNGIITEASSIIFRRSLNNGPLINNKIIRFEESFNNNTINRYDSLIFIGEIFGRDIFNRKYYSYNLGKIIGDNICTFSDAINSGTVSRASLIKSTNYGIVSSGLFSNLSINKGVILDEASFDRRSVNYGIVYGNGIFTNSSTNSISGSIYQTGQFINSSCNYGYVNILISDASCPSGSSTDGNLATSLIGLSDSNYFDSNYQNILYKN